ncbi:16S rRNA (guanine(966)-N(2))-methyltransferase RsmD [Pelobacter seleniigenes]|uniref:16S rRNA (guanine(966)-N(2))-methyltransferase RsmD n=1 Tax=Pelobacter seleniigenes TaxID=407188 RepID=UPI0004A768C1|nr:16S rRNA (guanine(966)-N(2))-methyltransferase RsmD [Pelobacter seleniigenes]
MRIISGTARGRKLALFSGKDIRPTPDRVREALFSMLASRFGSFDRLKVLELFAGSGALSLEALSRGAESALLVDSGAVAAELIRDNIQRCGFQSQASFIQQDIFRALPLLRNSAPYDLILLDPPYQKNLVPRALEQIAALNLLSEHGIICAESSSKEQWEDFGPLQLLESRTYGTSRIHLYGLTGE